jgi:hypothetical protein
MEIKGVADDGGKNFFRNIDTLCQIMRRHVPEESNVFLNCLSEFWETDIKQN